MIKSIVPLFVLILSLSNELIAQTSNAQLETIFEIGLDEEIQFGNISGVGRDAHGAIVLADRSTHTLYRIDADTSELQVVAREGHGPGELSGFWLMSRVRNTPGRILVSNIGTRQLQTYELQNDGSYIYTKSNEIQSIDGSVPGSVFMLADGRKLMAFPPSKSGAQGEESRVNFKILNQDGSVIPEVVYSIPEGNQSFVFGFDDGSVSMVRVPFGIRNYFEILPSGAMLTLNSHEFRVELTDMDGNSRTFIHEEIIGETVSPAELREIRSEYAGLPEIRPMFDLIPSTKPFIRQLFTDAESRIWIVYNRGESEFARAYTLEGEYLFEIPFFQDYSIRDVRNQQILIEYTSDDDFPHLKIVKADF